jgi:AraC-like DNA-binding protein
MGTAHLNLLVAFHSNWCGYRHNRKDHMARRLGTTDLELLEQLFGQLPESPFFVKDLELHYVAANMAMAQLCGVDRPNGLYGRRAAEFFPIDLAARYEALDHQVLRSGRAITNRLELTMGAGQIPAWLIFSRIPVQDESGATVGIAGTSRRLKQPEGAPPIYQRIADTLERLRQNSDQPLQLDELARTAGVSKSQLERDFHRLFGVTPRSFLQQVRIERALRLLETEASISTIAYECGYADHSAFTRRFRHITGTRPSAYRKRFRTQSD